MFGAGQGLSRPRTLSAGASPATLAERASRCAAVAPPRALDARCSWGSLHEASTLLQLGWSA